MVKRIVGWSNKIGRDDFEKLCKRGLTKAGIVISGEAITRCPVRTGRLRGSITYAVEGEQSQVSPPAGAGDKIGRPADRFICHIGSNVDYAQHIEYGTRHMAAQPYLRPAMDENRSRANQIFQDEIRKHFNA